MALDPSGLTKAQKTELRKVLETKLTSLIQEIKDLEAELTDENADGQGAADEVDRSSFEEEMQRMQLLLDGKKRLRADVQGALKRMDDGSYGVCEETEEPIGFARLRAQPWTRLSLEAQQDAEQRRKNQAVRSGSSMSYPGYDNTSGGSSGPSESDE